MKKKVFILFALVIALAALFYMKDEGVPVSENFEQSQETAVSDQTQQSLRFFSEKSQAPQNIQSSTSSGDSKGCQDAWGELSQLDTNLWGSVEGKPLDATFVFSNEKRFNQFKDKFNYSDRCQLNTNHPLWSINEEVRNACYSEGKKNQGTPETLNCMAALMRLRFDSIDHLTRNQEIEKIQDIGLIGAKLMSHILNGESDKKDLDKFVALSRRALELDPQNISAAEYWIQGSYMKMMQTNSGQDIDELEKAVERLKSEDPQSMMALEAQMAVARARGDFSEIQRLAEEAREGGVPTEKMDYQLAWASYLEGKEGDSESYLEKILEKNPEDLRAKSTLEIIRKSKDLPQELKENAAPFFSDLGSFQWGFAVDPTKND